MRWRWFEKKKNDLPQTEDRLKINPPNADLRCPLCGTRFQEGEVLACTGCALAARCGLVMCPNCSYEFAV
jgi:hypothetical protein